MKRFLTIICLSLFTVTLLQAQHQLANDSTLEQQILRTALVHAPLPIDDARSFEAYGWQKQVLQARTLIGIADALVMKFATYTGKRATGSPSDPDYATYGNCTVTVPMHNENLEQYNRITFDIYPNCDGARVVNMNLGFFNNPDAPAKQGYNAPTGAHLINLKNKEVNHCFLEIDEYQRDQVKELVFSTALKGKDRTTGDSARYTISNIQLQRVDKPTQVSGWIPTADIISYSTTGYAINHPKTAIVNVDAYPVGTPFVVIDYSTHNAIYEGATRLEKTGIGQFGVIDFSSLNREGQYQLRIGNRTTAPFRISSRVWDDSCWRILNYIFCQRCGHPVPGKHGICHVDLMADHNGQSLSFAGGWHDAGDLSQQTLQTGDVAFALLEAYNKLKDRNPALATRLREEAEWGIEFMLKCRFGDGYRASSMGLLIWQDGVFNSMDDIHTVRVQNFAYDNYLHAAYEAYAAMTLTHDPAMQEHLQRVAEEDFAFATQKFEKDGFDKFVQPYEHTYNTSHSQYMATVSWSASMLYKLTGKQMYADKAAEAIRYTLDCQRTQPLKDKNGTRGFFYRDLNKKSVVHYIHQSREQVYMQAMTLLCETQPNHPDYSRWSESIRLYGNYLKGLMVHTAPYGMIPSGVYHTKEYTDTENFYALHLFPPTNADQLYAEQIVQGIKLDKEHYVKRFPIWFNIFNGNTAIHLATGKAAAICGHFLNDTELLEIGMEQLNWTVGKNPFGQSLIYGEGNNYPQLNSFSSGEITGEIPVGIRTLGNSDTPYWPQTNNACYKEVWVTSAGKWLSLVAELE